MWQLGPITIDYQQIKLTDLVMAVGATLSLLLAVASLLWQRWLQHEALKADLFKLRLETLLAITRYLEKEGQLPQAVLELGGNVDRSGLERSDAYVANMRALNYLFPRMVSEAQLQLHRCYVQLRKAEIDQRRKGNPPEQVPELTREFVQEVIRAEERLFEIAGPLLRLTPRARHRSLTSRFIARVASDWRRFKHLTRTR